MSRSGLDNAALSASNGANVKTILPVTLALFFLAACASPERHATSEEPQVENRPGVLTIVSDPPGATIQVDGKSVGKTPCTVEIPVFSSNGKWLLKENVGIIALPPTEAENQTIQSKSFQKYSAAPQRVGFGFLKKSHGGNAGDDEEEFSSEWERITGGRSHEPFKH